MPIKLSKLVRQGVEVEVDFPLYFVRDLMFDDSFSVIYGMIEESGKCTTVCVCKSYLNGDESYEIESTKRSLSSYAAYPTGEAYKSNVDEFRQALGQALAFIQAI